MLRKSLMLSGSLGLARADICFEYGTGGFSIAVGAKVPAVPDTCIRVSLAEQLGPGSRAGVATGTICRAAQGSSKPTLVVQYTYDSCVGPGSYFESATCRLDLDINGDLPSAKDPSQISSCNGVYVGLLPGHSGPLHQLTDTTLKAWNCTPGPLGAVIGGGGAQCLAGQSKEDRRVTGSE